MSMGLRSLVGSLMTQLELAMLPDGRAGSAKPSARTVEQLKYVP